MNVLERFQLDDKVALVTGGNRGLGRAISQALAEAGAQVAVVSRKAEQAQAAADEIRQQTGRLCRGYACDVTVPEQIPTSVERVIQDFGQIDILINNAGININRPIEELSLEEFRTVQDTNLTGAWLMCRALAPHFKARKSGRLINVASTAATTSYPGLTPYSSSKAGLVRMTAILALEWGPFNVTANSILPGPFATEMNQYARENPQVNEQFLRMMPLRRWGEPYEIGGLVVLLASDAGSFITGASITIDGGRSA